MLPFGPRLVLLGVYVLPQLIPEVLSDWLCNMLALLAHSSRLEIQRHNLKGMVPRGRPEHPTERIEVDLSFLRFLETRFARARPAEYGDHDLYEDTETHIESSRFY